MRAARSLLAALALGSAACHASATPPTARVSRVVVRLDVETEGMPSRDECERVCPAARAGEVLAFCHATIVDGVLAKRRRDLGEHVSSAAGVACAFGPPGAAGSPAPAVGGGR